MKPNWDEAPLWANWWAIDEGDDDGFAECIWSDCEPLFAVGGYWIFPDEHNYELEYTVDYKNGPAYKEKRPEEH